MHNGKIKIMLQHSKNTFDILMWINILMNRVAPRITLNGKIWMAVANLKKIMTVDAIYVSNSKPVLDTRDKFMCNNSR